MRSPDRSGRQHGGHPSGSDRFAHLKAGAFEGKIHLVDTEAGAIRACLTLRRQRTVGLDTESRPSFRRGEIFPIALVQIATHSHAYLFRVRPGAPPRALKRFIQDPGIRKVVQGATEESRELRRDLEIEAKGFVDLPTVAKAAGLQEFNLRALAAAVLGIRISKGAQRSDWSRRDLTPAQLEYAATDAWACLAIYEKIAAGRKASEEDGGSAAVEVREATPEDVPAIVALVRELAGALGEVSQADPRVARAYLASPGCFVLVAEKAGQTLGMVSCNVRANLYHGGECALIEELVVHPSARRGGVGKALLDAAIRDARRKGCAEISVSTSAGNRAALALYRSAGLTEEAVLLEKHFGRPRTGARGRRRGRASGEP